MNVLFLGTGTIRTNGTMQRMLFIAKALAGSSIRLSIAMPDAIENKEFAARYLKHCNWLFFERGSAAKELLYKDRILRDGDYDFVHSFCLGVRFSIRPHWARNRRPRIVYDWDELLSSHRNCPTGIRLKNTAIERYSLSTGDGFTAASVYLRDYLAARANGRSVLFLPNGFDTELDVNIVSSEVLRKIEQSSAKKLIYVGAITKGYQIWELAELAVQIRERQLDWKIYVVGTGPDEQAFRSELRDKKVNEVVVLTGWVPTETIAGILRSADVLLFPFHASVQNTARCPLKIYQYVASGVPVVTNQVGEVARVLSEAGYYYPPGNVQLLLEACYQAVATKHQRTVGPNETLTWACRATAYCEWLVKWAPA
jgi:glycosyltransferase involved in cell wall biosynthesis